MAGFHLRLCWLCGCMCVIPWGGWMAGPWCIVEFVGPSSYTLIAALCWRIHEASSLIDSSVPFLPQPGQAESCYCTVTRCSEQSNTHSCTHAQRFQMDFKLYIFIYIDIKNPSLDLAKKNMQCTLFADGFPVFPTVCPPISFQWKPSTSLNPNSLCVFTYTRVCCCGSVHCKSPSTLGSLTIVSHCYCDQFPLMLAKPNIWQSCVNFSVGFMGLYLTQRSRGAFRLDNLATHNSFNIYFFWHKVTDQKYSQSQEAILRFCPCKNERVEKKFQ